MHLSAECESYVCYVSHFVCLKVVCINDFYWYWKKKTAKYHGLPIPPTVDKFTASDYIDSSTTGQTLTLHQVNKFLL